MRALMDENGNRRIVFLSQADKEVLIYMNSDVWITPELKRFKDDFQSTNCLELTGCDFKTDAGNEKFKAEGVMENICAPCVKRAVEIVEAIK